MASVRSASLHGGLGTEPPAESRGRWRSKAFDSTHQKVLNALKEVEFKKIILTSPSPRLVWQTGSVQNIHSMIHTQ